MNTDNIIHPKHRSDNFVNIIAGGNKLILRLNRVSRKRNKIR